MKLLLLAAFFALAAFPLVAQPVGFVGVEGAYVSGTVREPFYRPFGGWDEAWQRPAIGLAVGVEGRVLPVALRLGARYQPVSTVQRVAVVREDAPPAEASNRLASTGVEAAVLYRLPLRVVHVYAGAAAGLEQVYTRHRLQNTGFYSGRPEGLQAGASEETRFRYGARAEVVKPLGGRVLVAFGATYYLSPGVVEVERALTREGVVRARFTFAPLVPDVGVRYRI